MKKTINIIITILMIIIGIGIAVAESYYIIIKNTFGINVLKYSLCGFVCYIILSVICFILSIFIKENDNYKTYEESMKYKAKDFAGSFHIISFVISSIIMVVFFMDGGTKILGLILTVIFTMILPFFIRTVEHLPYVEEKVVARIYNNKGNKIGEIRK